MTRGDELDVALLLRELRETQTKVVIESGSVIDPSDLETAFLFPVPAQTADGPSGMEVWSLTVPARPGLTTARSCEPVEERAFLMPPWRVAWLEWEFARTAC